MQEQQDKRWRVKVTRKRRLLRLLSPTVDLRWIGIGRYPAPPCSGSSNTRVLNLSRLDQEAASAASACYFRLPAILGEMAPPCGQTHSLQTLSSQSNHEELLDSEALDCTLPAAFVEPTSLGLLKKSMKSMVLCRSPC